MRVLILSGYSHPSHHRKIELLADSPDVEILHVLPPGNGKASGMSASASGQHAYQVKVVPLRSLGYADDPHRIYHWPPAFQLRAFKPHLIHCEHEQEGLLAAEVALLRSALRPGTPLILYSWQNILRKRNGAVRLLSSFTLHAAQHMVCASREAVTVLQRQGYRRDATVMPLMGLDTRYFFPQSARPVRQLWSLNSFVIGYAGRLVAEKGIDTLLHAAAQCRAPVQVMLIGSGPEEGSLKGLASQLNLSERCRFVGAIAYNEMAAYLSALDLFVLPSRTTPQWKEQYGRALVEAMACRVPVVGSNSGAIPEVIGETGRLFPEGNAAALAANIDELAQDASLREMLAQQGFQRARSQYSVERLSAKTLAIWHKLSQPHSGERGNN
jgi:L-malate glycosyltransferase